MVSPLFLDPHELLPLIGTGQAPRLIDVCLAEDVAADPWRLPGAQHVSHGAIMQWAQGANRSAPVVIICQKGLKLSHGAAARLRATGFDARALTGGNQGWQDTNFPKVSLAGAPETGSIWVLPAPVTPQSLCLAWLIRRWFNPEAELIWVPQAMIGDVADRFDAEPASRTLLELCKRTALEYAPLVRFVSSVDANSAQWLPLLGPLVQRFDGAEAQLANALPIIDAAWTAEREAGQ